MHAAWQPRMLEIRTETSDDAGPIRAVNEAAFGTPAEADLVDVLRDDGTHVLSLVAVLHRAIVGHILFSPVRIESEDSLLHALGLGPMSVLPDRQRTGVGSRLVKEGLERCADGGHAAVVVLGHPAYYPRFGFVPADTYGITSEFDVSPETFMVKELRPVAFSGQPGTAKYHRAFRDFGRHFGGE